jgi:hypothetical protein
MQKLILLLAVVVCHTSCKKNHDSSPTPVPSIVGKWNITVVKVIPFDSTGIAINSGTVYTEPLYYYFQFNSDDTWTENLGPEPNSRIAENGTYALHSDSSFTLVNKNAPAKAVECAIDTLTNTRFVFTYRRSTLYNGITPGYLLYRFDLKK